MAELALGKRTVGNFSAVDAEADVAAPILRLREIDSRGRHDVAEAQLEVSGRVSVRKQEHAEDLQRGDLRGGKERSPGDQR